MRILLVDDSESEVRLIVDTLNMELPNVRVFRAMCKKELAESIAKNNIDIIFIDVDLGEGKNGYEVCKDLRASGWDKKIIIFTGGFEDFDIDYAKDCGADGIVPKSIGHRRLIKFLKQEIGEHKNE